LEDTKKRLGRKVKELRLKLGLTQEELAERADLHHNYIGLIEHGKKNVTIHVLQRVAGGLRVELGHLFQFEQAALPLPLVQLQALLQHQSEEDLVFLLAHIEHMLQWRVSAGKS